MEKKAYHQSFKTGAFPNTLNFAITPKQREWQKIANDLSENVLARRAVKVDREGDFPHDNFKELADSGLMGLLVPEDLGGPGGDTLTSVLVIEALSRGCASTGICYHMHMSGSAMVISLAEGEQVDKFVKPILTGDAVYTYATSEPGSGSRWWHFDGISEKVGDEYVLEAVKSFVTSADVADYYITPVRATPFSGPRELSIFLVDSKDEQVQTKGKWDGMGLRGNESPPVQFKKCRVPVINRLGDSGAGFPFLLVYALPTFNVGIAATYLGIAQNAFEAAVKHVAQRVHTDTDQPLSRVESVQRYIGEMKMQLDQTRLMVYLVAKLIDEMVEEHTDLIDVADDIDFLLAIAEVKVISCQMAIDVTNKAVQVSGGAGYRRGQVVERCYRDARAGSLMGLNDDVLKTITGRLVMGLPFPWEDE